MMTPHIHNRRPAPLWAPLGLTLLVMPILVMVLALAAPERTAVSPTCEGEIQVQVDPESGSGPAIGKESDTLA